MRILLTTASLVGLVFLSACSPNPPQAGSQMSSPTTGSSSAMPQSSNSLPVGDAVNAPRAPATGRVGTTVVR